MAKSNCLSKNQRHKYYEKNYTTCAQLRRDQHYPNSPVLLARDIAEVTNEDNQRGNAFRGLNIHWNKILTTFDLQNVITMQERVDSGTIKNCETELQVQVNSKLTPSGKWNNKCSKV